MGCPRRRPWTKLRTPVCSYPIEVFQLSFNFLCLLLLYSIYLNGQVTLIQFSKIIFWTNCVHSWRGVGVTAYIHGTELIRFRKVTLSGFCVHCIPYSGIHLADFMFLLYIAQSRVLGFFSSRPNWDPPPPQPQESVSPLLCFRGEGVTCLRVRGSLYGVDVNA